MLALQEAGPPTGAIAKRLGVGQRTIQRWLAEGHGPYAGPRKPQRCPLNWSTRCLRERWEAGGHNGMLLWKELKTQGYRGSMRSVYRRLATWRDHSRKSELPASHGSILHSPLEDVAPGQVSRWMLARSETLRPEAKAQLDRLRQMDDQLAQARELTHGFLDLIRHHKSRGTRYLAQRCACVHCQAIPPLCSKSRAGQTSDSGGTDASLQYRSGRRAYHPPETRSVDKRMAELGCPPCNTASCQLLDQWDLRRLSPATVRHGSHLILPLLW
jgi:hypothetical protein